MEAPEGGGGSNSLKRFHLLCIRGIMLRCVVGLRNARVAAYKFARLTRTSRGTAQLIHNTAITTPAAATLLSL